ncbi:hypothetical protein ACU686_14305 [Yinghuangia aomiensis]
MGRLRGLLLGLGAYVLWGLFPLYWPLLKPAGAVELLAHRTVWSMVAVIGLLAVERRWAWVREVVHARAALGRCVLAAVTLTFNWGCTSTASTPAVWSRRPSATSSPRWFSSLWAC